MPTDWPLPETRRACKQNGLLPVGKRSVSMGVWWCMWALLLPALASASAHPELPRSVSQGQLVIAHVAAGSDVRLDGQALRVGDDGS